MITRKCVICGKEFECYPSDKKVTCSNVCRRERQRRIVSKQPVKWSDDAKKRLSERGQTENLKLGTDAAKRSPIAGRFETNQEAKIWTLIDPSGREITVRNLLLWARENTQLFGKPPGDKSAEQIACGFRAIAQTLNGNRGAPGKPRGAKSYFGWTLRSAPEEPSNQGQERDLQRQNETVKPALTATAKDLTGQRFGKLTVIEPTEKRFHGSVVWKCICDCGNKCEVPQTYLKSGSKKDCGRCRKRADKKEKISVTEKDISETYDLTGMVFGELTAVKPTNKRYYGSVIWECRCSCGNLCYAPAMTLKSGLKKSCGHLLYEDLRGKRFNRLVVMSPVKRSQRSGGTKRWVCRCDCGNIRVVPSHQLKSGGIKSCGCARKNMRDELYSAFCPACGEKFAFRLAGEPTPQFCPNCAPKYSDCFWRVCPICGKLFRSMENGSDIACSKECLSEWMEKVKNSYPEKI